MAAVIATVFALLVSAVYAGHVPAIPAGHRAEYNLLLRGGGFKYGFDTGSGQTAQVQGDASNEVRGGYAYQSPAGPIGVHYSAGVGGFVPSTTGGLQAPALPPVTGGAAGWGRTAGIKSSWSTGGAPWAADYPAIASVHGPIGPIRPDGSYSFAYSTGDQSRQESGDADNNVRGSFSFRAKDDGATRTVNYMAGARTGFVAQGAHLPTPPPLAVSPGLGMGWGDSQVNVGAAEGQWNDGEGEGGQGAHGDASYQFGYQTGDASRQEASDESGNIRGSYSFVTTDGENHRVDYEAGAGKGFVATGDVIPKDGVAQAAAGSWQPRGGIQSSWQSGPSAGVQQAIQPSWQGVQQTIQPTWQGDSGIQQTIQPTWQGDSGVQQSIQPTWQGSSGVQRSWKGGAEEPANTQISQRGDGSYSFSYSTPDQSRQEAADAKGNVQGSFSFVAKDDGKSRRVDYIAGADTGFIAKGDHLPKPQPSEVQPGGGLHIDSKVGLPDYDDTQQTLLGSGEGGSGEAEGSGDASYQFSYQNKDSSRQEAADAKGNVQGSFSFVAPDGLTRRVDYEAGAGKGFVARGDHLPKEGDTGAGARRGQWQADDEQQTQGPMDQTTLQEDDLGTQAPWSHHGGSGEEPAVGARSGDASYSYAYETDSSRKHESADAQGNVKGSFSYIDASGKTKTVTYTARKGEGFIAEGDHLPKPGQFLEGPSDVHGGSGGRFRGSGGAGPRLGVGAGVKTSWSSAAPRQQAVLPLPAAVGPAGVAGKAVVDQHVGDGVLRTYLPPHNVKAGYVFEAKTG